MNNLVDLLLRSSEKYPDRPALCDKKSGHYRGMSYKQLHKKVDDLAAAFISMGVKKNDHVALLCKNRPEWVIADLATMSVGAACAPIYTTLPPNQVEYIINDCQASVIVVETKRQLNMMLSGTHCPKLKHIICINVVPKKLREISEQLNAITVHSFDQLTRFGHELNQKEPGKVDAIRKSINRTHLASIVYTSGTTGHPKGVLLTHGNFLSNVENILEALPIQNGETVLSFLPLSHVFERTAGYYTLLAVSGTIYYAESIETVRNNIVETRPSVLISVPRLYEKMKNNILSSASPIKKIIINWALKVGKKAAKKKRKGFQYLLANLLVFRKLRQKTGGRLRFFVSGGAPLSKEVAEFFGALGLPIIEGYGMTETAPVVACNRLGDIQPGSIGKVLPNQQVKLDSDGELLTKGDNITAGYYNLPEKTKELFTDDGWLRTGDIATIDTDGFIRIIDRKKELIVLSNGKNVPPQKIETKMALSPFVSQIMVIGDQRSYITALIVPDFELIRRHAHSKKWKLEDTSNTALAVHEKVHRLFDSIIKELQQEFASFETIKRYTLLSKEFQTESGELTPSLKLKRKVIELKYKTVIDKMYEK